jgi:addiction module HigA family antidote
MTSKSPGTTSKSPHRRPKLPPVHPGEILKETLDDLGLSMNRLAQAIRVPANRISAVVAGRRAITGETALRLARYFNTTPAYWMNMQARYDLETARDEWESRIESDVRPRDAA